MRLVVGREGRTKTWQEKEMKRRKNPTEQRERELRWKGARHG